MAQTIITPKRGKNLITKGAKLFTKKLGENQLANMEDGKQVGDFNGEELPSTVQGRRIRWSLGKAKYLMLDDKGRELNDEQIQEFVKRSYLTYEDGADKGKLITSADPFNRKDPFFNHGQLWLLLKEGNGKLDTDNQAKDRLLLAGMRGHSEFAGARDGNLRSGAVRYVISDKEQEAAMLSEERMKNIDAIRLFVALTDAKKLVIAKVMNLGVNETNDRNTIDNAIYNAIISTRVDAEGTPLKQVFIYLCNLPSDELNLRYLIANAITNQVIKGTKSGFTFRGNRIASTRTGLFDYFKKGDNHETLMLLEEAMGRVTVFEEPRKSEPVAEVKQDDKDNTASE